MRENPSGLNIQQADIEDNFVTGLEAWAYEDTALEGEKRVEAMRRIIEARSSRSTKLTLAHLKLSSLPPQIGELTDLTTLNLVGNQLTMLPDQICELTALTDLYLTFNQLTTLPERIGDLTSLKILKLHSNRLTTLPKRICDLTSLEILDINRNQLTALPDQICKLTALRVLNLSQSYELTPSPALLDGLCELEERGCQIDYPEQITPQVRFDRAESRLKQTARTLLLGNLDRNSKLSELDTGIIHEVLGFISSHQLSEEKKKEILEAAERDVEQTERYKQQAE